MNLRWVVQLFTDWRHFTIPEFIKSLTIQSLGLAPGLPLYQRISQRGLMLTIQRVVTGVETVFKVSGRIDAENIAEVKALFALEANGQGMILDLKDLTLVDREAVRFLERLESDSAKLTNCPLYIREWILRERGASELRKRRASQRFRKGGSQ